MRRSLSLFAQQRRVLRHAGLPGILLAVFLSGCASSSEYDQSWYGGDRVAMEDDGLPAQLPPLHRRKPETDDPREPFSPNYGPPPQPSLPADLPPAFRRKLIDAVSIS